MPPIDACLVSRPRTPVSEHDFQCSPNDTISLKNFDSHHFTRISAKKIHFRQVSFKYCIFDDAYLRDCKFEDCDFTGSTFRNSTLRGSTFDGSRFDYCRFSHTIVPATIIVRHMPGFENVALELARTLRVNYGQIGDFVSANKAILAELEATRIHLRKAAWANESYYREKYTGLNRLGKILEYYWFLFLDFIWGSGESLPKLIRTILIVFGLGVFFVHNCGDALREATRDAFLAFWGISTVSPIGSLTVSAMVATRTLLLGLFVAVLVRRLSRR